MREDDAEIIREELNSALTRLRSDIDRVELWAGALAGFAQPVPDYDQMSKFALPRSFSSPDKQSN